MSDSATMGLTSSNNSENDENNRKNENIGESNVIKSMVYDLKIPVIYLCCAVFEFHFT